MAKVRNLKKDIDFITSEIIEECFFACLVHEDVKEEQVGALMKRVLALNEEYIRRANHPDGKADRKLIKKYYKQLSRDFVAESNALVEEINNLSVAE